MTAASIHALKEVVIGGFIEVGSVAAKVIDAARDGRLDS
jgi:hypothetical protein